MVWAELNPYARLRDCVESQELETGVILHESFAKQYTHSYVLLKDNVIGIGEDVRHDGMAYFFC